MALDASGHVHISYYAAGPYYDLRYATNASGSWATTTVDSSGDVGLYTSLALDADGKAHISYYYSNNADLKYATNASGYWVTTMVDSIEEVGMYTSIALDTSNKAYISYYDSENRDLKYATNVSGMRTSIVDSSGGVRGVHPLLSRVRQGTSVIMIILT